jgi:hypothetical protein
MASIRRKPRIETNSDHFNEGVAVFNTGRGGVEHLPEKTSFFAGLGF